MTERPTAAYIGEADASKKSFQKEATPPSPEERQVKEAMEKSGEVLANKIADAQEQAGKQLQGLHGKELVKAGLRQVGHGAWETLKSEVGGAVRGMVIGGLAGAALGSPGGSEGMAMGASSGISLGGLIGGVAGYERAGIRYNKKVAPEKNLPKTEWYDWITGNASYIAISTFATRARSVPGYAVATAASFFANPISLGGLRNIATGMWQMRKG